jgi:hypothetical protein
MSSPFVAARLSSLCRDFSAASIVRAKQLAWAHEADLFAIYLQSSAQEPSRNRLQHGADKRDQNHEGARPYSAEHFHGCNLAKRTDSCGPRGRIGFARCRQTDRHSTLFASEQAPPKVALRRGFSLGDCRSKLGQPIPFGDVVFRHVCTHEAYIRARRGYEPTHETAIAAVAKGPWRGPAGRRQTHRAAGAAR